MKKNQDYAIGQEFPQRMQDDLRNMSDSKAELYKRGLMGCKDAIKAIDTFNKLQKGIQQQNTIVV